MNIIRKELNPHTNWAQEFEVFAINRDSRMFEFISDTQFMTIELFEDADEDFVSDALASFLCDGGDYEFVLYNRNHELVGFVYYK